jgi:hypothetical protein
VIDHLTPAQLDALGDAMSSILRGHDGECAAAAAAED